MDVTKHIPSIEYFGDSYFGVDFNSLQNFDMSLADPVARSLRLNGKSTCIRLEQIYWAILHYAALHRHVSVNVLLSALDRDVQLRFGDVRNFSSLVRVVSVAQVAKTFPGLLSPGSGSAT